MYTNFRKRSLSFILCSVLIVAMAFITSGCNDKTQKESEAAAVVQESMSEVSQSEASQKAADAQIVGEGETVFPLSVVDASGKETLFEVHTDKATVGEALLELKLIEGEIQQYGLYIKKVNGITADYDENQTYWAFYVNDAYAQAGVDQTKIEESSSYSLRVEK
ncbi:MAG: DUF4430 domain-containing protein [Lachnospiraceae bacterium]|nr:DUF4430 domain-containing protein [Lachnospiraceae bacterium]